MFFTVNNAPLYAYTGGKAFDATKPTAILIHGVLCDHSVWALQSRYLANHGWNVLAIDLPGDFALPGGTRRAVQAGPLVRQFGRVHRGDGPVGRAVPDREDGPGTLVAGSLPDQFAPFRRGLGAAAEHRAQRLAQSERLTREALRAAERTLRQWLPTAGAAF